MSLRRQRGSCTEGGGQQGPSQKGGEKTDGVGEPSQTWIPSKRPSGTPEVGSQWFICQNTVCSLVISSGQNPRGNLHWPHCPGALCSQGVWSACPHSSRSLRSRKAQQTAAHETLLQAFDSIVAVVQLLTCVQLSATPWTAAHQASLSFIISQSLLKLMSIELVMPSNHLILFRPLVLLPSIFPSIRVFSNDLALHIRWPEY